METGIFWEIINIAGKELVGSLGGWATIGVALLMGYLGWVYPLFSGSDGEGKLTGKQFLKKITPGFLGMVFAFGIFFCKASYSVAKKDRNEVVRHREASAKKDDFIKSLGQQIKDRDEKFKKLRIETKFLSNVLEFVKVLVWAIKTHHGKKISINGSPTSMHSANEIGKFLKLNGIDVSVGTALSGTPTYGIFLSTKTPEISVGILKKPLTAP